MAKDNDENTRVHIPSEGVVDDRNTIESQLIGKTGGARPSAHLTIQIKKYLSDMTYPATKADLYSYAAGKGASDEVLEAIDSLQADSYVNYEQVSNEIDENK